MPSDQSTWLLAVPHNDESDSVAHDISSGLIKQGITRSPRVGLLNIPVFKTGTLESLIALSEELPKQDAYFSSVVSKLVEILRSLLNNDLSKVSQHTRVNDVLEEDYLTNAPSSGWKWNEGRYNIQRSLRELTDSLSKEMSSIDNTTKNKLNNYNLAKGSLQQLRRKQTGNLSVRSLVDVVQKDDLLQDSEFLETMLVAVPKNQVKDWNSRYERLSTAFPMVVPRSSSKLAEDSEYTLFSVVVFKRHRDEFAQKCRENKFVLREFEYSDEQVLKQRRELAVADDTERELWTELLRLSRANFSESYQLLMHLKVVRLFIESVLRYGLPAQYIGIAIRPEQKSVKRTLGCLMTHFSYLASQKEMSSSKQKAMASTENKTELAGEYQQIMEQEYFDFVLFEIPWSS